MASLEAALPRELQPFFRILFMPVRWIASVQEAVIRFVFDSSSQLEMTVKILFLLLPALLLVGGLWCTVLSIYTIPFRAKRRLFIIAMLTSWWDSGRAVALYWIGMFKAVLVSLGWVWGFICILVTGVYLAVLEVLTLPFSLFRRGAERTLEPSTPWIAMALMMLWVLLEAGMFSYTLYPTVSEIAADLAGTTDHPWVQPILFVVLSLLIAGSFACVQVLVDAVKRWDIKEIIQMVLVELFVMFVEVVFLYREMVDAIIPVLAQQSGGQMKIGVAGVLVISTVAWIGMRGMTWFLFGRFGTPMLLGIISGHGFVSNEAAKAAEARESAAFTWAMNVIGKVKADVEWFHRMGRELVEAYVLPPLQVVAAGVNFFMILFNGRALLGLPLQKLHAFVETSELLKPARASGPRDSGS